MKRALCILTALIILCISLPASAAMLGAKIITQTAAPESTDPLLTTEDNSDFDFILFSTQETQAPAFSVFVTCDGININYKWNPFDHRWELTPNASCAAITLKNNGDTTVNAKLTPSGDLPDFLLGALLTMNPQASAIAGSFGSDLEVFELAPNDEITCYLAYIPRLPTGIEQITGAQVSIDIELSETQPIESAQEGGEPDGGTTL